VKINSPPKTHRSSARNIEKTISSNTDDIAPLMVTKSVYISKVSSEEENRGPNIEVIPEEISFNPAKENEYNTTMKNTGRHSELQNKD
jgi:hypothetical protein